MSALQTLLLEQQDSQLKPKRWLETDIALVQQAIPQMTEQHCWCPRFCGCKIGTRCNCTNCPLRTCVLDRLQKIQQKLEANRDRMTPVDRVKVWKCIRDCQTKV